MHRRRSFGGVLSTGTFANALQVSDEVNVRLERSYDCKQRHAHATTSSGTTKHKQQTPPKRGCRWAAGS